jgi:hypothetical protein
VKFAVALLFTMSATVVTMSAIAEMMSTTESTELGTAATSATATADALASGVVLLLPAAAAAGAASEMALPLAMLAAADAVEAFTCCSSATIGCSTVAAGLASAVADWPVAVLLFARALP